MMSRPTLWLVLLTYAQLIVVALGSFIPHDARERSSESKRASSTVSQPVIWEDLADIEIIRVDDTFYYSASTMAYSPGAPILKSTDLQNWEYIGHSVPSLDFGSGYNMTDGNTAYVKGIWASSLKYRPSNGQWYWIGCIEFANTYVYTASSPTGPWTQHAVFEGTCYYDCGLLFDENDTPQVAYGSTNIQVATLSSDLTSQVSNSQVFSYDKYVEGSRFYYINGFYYILGVQPGAAIEYVIKSSSPTEGYTGGNVVANAPSCPVSNGGAPHQGGIVDDPQGNWYYMAFCDAYPGGRIPVLASITFDDDNFPVLSDVNSWPSTVEVPLDKNVLSSPTGTDEFSGTTLGHQWEWNHNPDETAFDVDDGLTLRTATVTDSLYQARNTLTHRVLGPASDGTIEIDFSNMKSGDRAGLAMFRDVSGWIGIIKTGESAQISVWKDITMNSDWTTNSIGALETSKDISETSVFLRASADIRPGGAATAQFSYSTDGATFTDFGTTFSLNTTWEFFMGYRFGIFNFATDSLGGSVEIKSFDLALSD
jgi:beta-xylosidase